MVFDRDLEGLPRTCPVPLLEDEGKLRDGCVGEVGRSRPGVDNNNDFDIEEFPRDAVRDGDSTGLEAFLAGLRDIEDEALLLLGAIREVVIRGVEEPVLEMFLDDGKDIVGDIVLLLYDMLMVKDGLLGDITA